jgi:hypothetical protein
VDRSYALRTKTLYSKRLEEESDPICWVPEDIPIIESLKQQSLITAPVLALPSLDKPLNLFVNVDKEAAFEVLLTQKHGGKIPPVA